MEPLAFIISSPISKKSLFDVITLESNKMIWCNLLVTSDEVWSITAPTVSLLSKKFTKFMRK